MEIVEWSGINKIQKTSNTQSLMQTQCEPAVDRIISKKSDSKNYNLFYQKIYVF